jgi:DNA-binding NarL/FixJ family response regulator
MAYGLRAALVELMPELKCLVCRGTIGMHIEAFGRVVVERRPQMTLFDADSVPVQEILAAFGKRAIGPQGIFGKIVVLTTKPDDELLFTLAMYGASAYVSGCLPGGELAQLVRDLLANDQLSLLDSRVFDDPDLAFLAGQRLQMERVTHVWQAVPQSASEEIAPKTEEEQDLLSELELRLVRGLSCGMSTHVAARHAGISYWYAKGLIPEVTQKLQAGNRTGAVVRAWQLGLIELPETEMIKRYAGTSSGQTGISDERVSDSAPAGQMASSY